MKEKKMDGIKYLVLLPPIIIFLAATMFLPSANCREHEDFKKQYYRGIVLKKFLNYKNHKHETITIQTNEKKFDFLLIKERQFFAYIEEGDSLIKNASDSIEVKRGVLYQLSPGQQKESQHIGFQK